MSTEAGTAIAIDRTQAQPNEAAVIAALGVLDRFMAAPTGTTADGIIAAGPAKVHLDVQFTRYRANNSVIGSFRSLWNRHRGRRAVAARSSLAD